MDAQVQSVVALTINNNNISFTDNHHPHHHPIQAGHTPPVMTMTAAPETSHHETVKPQSSHSRNENLEIRTSQEWKREGNAAFELQDFRYASQAYLNGLQRCGPDDVETRVQLYSNRAMCLIKLQEYDEAQTQCTIVLDELHQRNLPKVWFRRALARQGQSTTKTEPKHKEALLKLALRDLEQATRTLEESNDPSKGPMFKSIQTTKQKMETSLAELLPPEPRPPIRDCPPLEQQRTNILQLLSATHGIVRDTQAFFLVDWTWWCKFCHYVLLDQESGESLTDLLLPVGSAPKVASGSLAVPEAIDNSSLLLPKTVYYSQWYDLYAGQDKIKPHLVRGFHFEVLPREVYQALRSWYGELTPSICRRASSHNGITRVSLYPLEVTAAAVQPPVRCAACLAPHATSFCSRCSLTRYCDRVCQESHWPYHQLECPDKIRNGRSPGGLNNLGNTCFMNATVQALSHCSPLTRYFLSNGFLNDINRSNPLGTGGTVAKAYCTTLKDLWMNQSLSTSPTALKRAIATFAPRFAGCLQHDAQEFLAFLLDGLHEDLNRVKDAPYVELPDVDENDNMKVAGARAWEAHLQRNDSLVMDCFYGQFKSTCVCPGCSRVSVSFDAFNHVSLEIPQEIRHVVYTVLFFPSSPQHSPEHSLQPVKYGIELPLGCSVMELKTCLSKLNGHVPVPRITICEVFGHVIQDLLKDNKPLDNPEILYYAYDLDPLSSSEFFHAIVNHKLVFSELSESTDKQIEGHDKEDMSRKVCLGYPLITSFPSDSTCRQAWEHLWKAVSYAVEADDRSLLRVRIESKDAVPNFPDDPSVLPRDLDEPLSKFLAQDVLDNFVFISLEWLNAVQPEGEEKEGGKVVEERFQSFVNHSSWAEAMKQDSLMNGPNGVALDQCFAKFTKPERLDEQNMWYCSRCKDHVQAMKTMEIWRVPNILVVHLKRFEFKHMLRREKLDTLVDFPLEGLDMSKHCSSVEASRLVDDQVPCMYDLFGVVNHYGRMGFGHYTAFARTWDESTMSPDWMLFDDSSTRTIHGQSPCDAIVSPAAYVLFYRRRVFH